MIKRIQLPTLLNTLLLSLLFILTLYPFWYVLIMSLSTYNDVIGSGLLLLPKGFSLDSILFVLNSNGFLKIYGNTGFVVIVGTILSILGSMCLAYPLTRKIPGHRLILGMIFFTLLFSGGMIPTYLVVRSTGLLNNLWALILPVLINPFNVFILRNFFLTIPDSLIESSEIDGAGVLRTMFQIVFPVSLPGIATVALFYAVSYWNSFFEAVIYMSNRSKWTLQVLLREILINVQPDVLGGTAGGIDDMAALLGPTVKMATVIVVIIPIMLIYPFVQKYFIHGIMIGAVKG